MKSQVVGCISVWQRWITGWLWLWSRGTGKQRVSIQVVTDDDVGVGSQENQPNTTWWRQHYDFRWGMGWIPCVKEFPESPICFHWYISWWWTVTTWWRKYINDNTVTVSWWKSQHDHDTTIMIYEHTYNELTYRWQHDNSDVTINTDINYRSTTITVSTTIRL